MIIIMKIFILRLCWHKKRAVAQNTHLPFLHDSDSDAVNVCLYRGLPLILSHVVHNHVIKYKLQYYSYYSSAPVLMCLLSRQHCHFLRPKLVIIS